MRVRRWRGVTRANGLITGSYTATETEVTQFDLDTSGMTMQTGTCWPCCTAADQPRPDRDLPQAPLILQPALAVHPGRP